MLVFYVSYLDVAERLGWGKRRTVCAAVVEEDVCVLCLVLGVILRNCDLVLVAFAGA